jgi:hypothetical protein
MNRSQWILAGVLAVQVLLILLFRAGGESTGSLQPHALLPGLAELEPAGIRISDGSEETITLIRTEGSWILGDPDGYPADAGKIRDLLEDLESLQVRRPVVSSDRYHDTLKVTEEEHERRVRIYREIDDDPAFELFLGSSPNYRIHHVRLSGDDRVYEQQALTPYALDTGAGSWVDQEPVDLPAGAVIVGVTLRNGHGAFEAESVEGTWRLLSPPGAGEPDGSAVDSWVRSLVTLRLSEPAGEVDDDAHGYADPAAVLELIYETETDERAAIRIIVGAETGEDGGARYARVGESAYSVVLSGWEARKLTDKKPEDLQAGDS